MKITEDQMKSILEIVNKSNSVSCDEITNEDYWNESWTECPVCGCKPDGAGIWVHGSKQ